jgi:DNA-binding NarL/FixJ family response regulator
MIRVVIADDHAVVRTGLQELLNSESDVEVVGTARDGQEAVDLVRTVCPDVLLVDLSMPVMDGIAATRRVTAEMPQVQVVVLTSFVDQKRILDALDAGAAGYILKDADPAELAGAVRAAAAGGSPLDPKAARVLLDAKRTGRAPTPLSAREQEVLRLVAGGLANKNIARRLGIAERTVKAHLTSIFQSIGVADRTQAALWARENLQPEPLEPL